ncbi:MAG: iron ABC transporter permease [Oscillospiraceae bacterium]|jgi:iron complex transport system permease protein
MSSKFKPHSVIFACFILVILTSVLGICFGAVNLSASELIDGILTGAKTPNGRIVLYSRLPRVLGTALAGSSLAVSGAIIQSVLGNPLASPNIIGVNSGAGFFTVLCLALFPSAYKLLPAAAFLGAIISVMTVYLIARKTGASKITLVLAGVAIASLFNAGINTVTTFFPDSLSGINAFKIGGVTGLTLDRLSPAWAFITIGIIAALLLNHELDILSLGDKTAQSLGMNVRLIRFLLLMISALLAGAAVSFAGLIGFVGLIVPHISRHFVGNESRFLIPVCALSGAAFVTLCDIISRTLFAPYEIALGIVISYIGVPFFIGLLLKKRGGRHSDKN